LGASVVCCYLVDGYARESGRLWLVLFIIARRIFITANIHGMVLGNWEWRTLDLASTRRTQYNWHVFGWLFGVGLTMWYYNIMQQSKVDLKGKKIDVFTMPVETVMKPVWYTVSLLMLAAVPASLHMLYQYWGNWKKNYIQPIASDQFPKYSNPNATVWNIRRMW
jgi:hypothetical protein